ncbi:hypothetical protein LX36DRAFT_650648 [Colletotrichum falcatum]|nr:hypothetical protein LX36DRAFT_650648 [Colletotrichum falcatum]
MPKNTAKFPVPFLLPSLSQAGLLLLLILPRQTGRPTLQYLPYHLRTSMYRRHVAAALKSLNSHPRPFLYIYGYRYIHAYIVQTATRASRGDLHTLGGE